MADDQDLRRIGPKLLIAIGRLGRPHGVKGELKLKPYFGPGLVEGLAGRALFLERERGAEPGVVVMVSARGADPAVLVSFEGINTPEKAAALANRQLLSPRAWLPDPPSGGYYYEEIVGLPVFDPEGAPLGRLSSFFEAGGADVWVISSSDGGEIMIPCLPETLVSVDLINGRIVMAPMKEEE